MTAMHNLSRSLKLVDGKAFEVKKKKEKKKETLGTANEQVTSQKVNCCVMVHVLK